MSVTPLKWEEWHFCSGRMAEASEIEALFCKTQCVDTEIVGSYTEPAQQRLSAESFLREAC